MQSNLFNISHKQFLEAFTLVAVKVLLCYTFPLIYKIVCTSTFSGACKNQEHASTCQHSSSAETGLENSCLRDGGKDENGEFQRKARKTECTLFVFM